MDYLPAWIIIAVMAIVGSVCLVFLTRPMASSWFRTLLRVLPGMLLVAPAPVPGYPGVFAPAFVVLVFEGLFQSGGNALGAASILGATAILVTLIVVVTHRLGGSAAAQVEDSEEN
jgi:hypothetical protein